MVANLVASPKLLAVGLLAFAFSGCGVESGSNPELPLPSAEESPATPAGNSTASDYRTSFPSEPESNSVSRELPPGQSHLNTFPFFLDIAGESGVLFTYLNGAAGQVLMVEATGGGAGWFDCDGDGRLDLFLCQGGDPAVRDRSGQPSDQLFRQVRARIFEPVADVADISEKYYSQGVAIADFDDDGFEDVFVTNVGPDTLLHNLGDGTFQNVSIDSGIADVLWSSSAAWGDLDGDYDLDLYVCNYVDYDPYNPLPCGSDGQPGTCHPMHVKGVPDACFINQGDGTFKDESQARGLFGPDNKALGVVLADFNNDDLPDVYVANDTTANFLFINQGGGVFTESANMLGCAVNRDGLTQASMGVALGDYDQNGWLDLYCTHFTKESNTLYKNLGETGFQDVTGLVGLHTPTLKFLGFGTVMKDFNQDGHEDIFVANGHVDDWRDKGDDYQMKPQLFSFEGPRFVECTTLAGEFFAGKRIARAAAHGDFDNDGDWDLAVVHQNTPTAILQNDSSRGNWLKFRCVANHNRGGLGTRIVLRQSERALTQELAGGTSYCSSHEKALIFGLGDDPSPVDLEIRWPDGSHQSVRGLSINQEWILRQSSDGLDAAGPQVRNTVVSGGE